MKIVTFTRIDENTNQTHEENNRRLIDSLID